MKEDLVIFLSQKGKLQGEKNLKAKLGSLKQATLSWKSMETVISANRIIAKF